MYMCIYIYISTTMYVYIYIHTVNCSRSVYLMIISRVLLRVFRLTSQSAEVPKDVEKGSGS